MSKKLIDNFDLRIKKSLDKRLSVDNLTDIDRPYEGLLSFQKSDKDLYLYKDGSFVNLLNSLVARFNKLQTIIDVTSPPNSLSPISGNGTDETTKLQNIIDYASTQYTSAIILIPNITVKVNSLNMKSNLTLTGINREVSCLQHITNATANLLKCDTVSSVIISNLLIDGNKTNQNYASGLDNIYINNCSNIIVKNNDSKNAYNAHGVHVNNSTNILIEENLLDNNQGSGIVIGACTQLVINNNTIDSNLQYGIQDDTSVATSTTIIITNNTIQNNTTSGVTIQKSNYVKCDGNLIQNNYLHGIWIKTNFSYVNNNRVYNNGHAIDTQGIVIQATQSMVQGNEVRENKGVAIDLGDCYNVIVDGNLIYKNGVFGVEVNSSENCVVSNNIICYNNDINYSVTTPSGIYLHQSDSSYGWTGVSKKISIIGNIVLTGTYQTYGIMIEADSIDVSIVGNSLNSSGNTDDLNILTTSYVLTGNVTRMSNHQGLSTASAWDLTLGLERDFFVISGTTTINRILSQKNIGTKITMKFLAVCAINDVTNGQPNANIKLKTGTSLTTTANQIIQLVFDGTYWWVM